MQFFDELPGNYGLRGNNTDWAAAKADLMKNPGQWGLIIENVAASTASQLRTGKNQMFRGDELKQFDFRIRRPTGAKGRGYADRRTDLYGRFTEADQLEAKAKRKKFTSLNHPEADEDGVQRYTVFEMFADGKHERVANNLTSKEVDDYIDENGEWDDA